MKNILIIILTLVSLSFAEDTAIKDKLYKDKEVTPGSAFISSLLIPSLGHRLTDNNETGYVYLGVRAAALGGFLMASTIADDSKDYVMISEKGIYVIAGIGAYTLLGIAEGIHAMVNAGDHNKRVYREIYNREKEKINPRRTNHYSYNLSPIISKKHTGASLSITF